MNQDSEHSMSKGARVFAVSLGYAMDRREIWRGSTGGDDIFGVR